jgi:hypothetical protein
MRSVELETMTHQAVLKLLGARIRHTLNTGRKATRLGKMTELEAKGAVIGRMANVLDYTREIKAKPNFQIPGTCLSAYRDGEYFLKIQASILQEWNQTLSNIETRIVQQSSQTLADLETRAGVPAGTAGHGYCVRCGRTLTAIDSVAAGIGPVCSGKVKRS